jgi:hypothetical protein
MKKAMILLPRGEAIRNFVYTGFLDELAKTHQLIVYSVVNLQSENDQIELRAFPKENPTKWHAQVRTILDIGHEYNTNSVRHRYGRKIRFHRTIGLEKLKEYVKQALGFVMSGKWTLNHLNALENRLHLNNPAASYWGQALQKEKPAWLLNTSHIHGFGSELPCKVALSMGVPVYGFVFSWDNLTTRSRITIHYNKLFLWHARMKGILSHQYGKEHALTQNAIVTGTPQFDTHQNQNEVIPKRALLDYLNISDEDESVGIVLYSTAMATDFPQEHFIIRDLINWFEDEECNTQNKILVIRPYIKGITDELRMMMKQSYKRIRFMPVLWEEAYFTPKREDAKYYKAILNYASVGINIASTVSLELMIYGTHVINIGFDHPKANYPSVYKYEQHLEYDHYKEVVDGGGVHVATSMPHLFQLIETLCEAEINHKGIAFMDWFFDGKLTFNSTQKILNHVQKA